MLVVDLSASGAFGSAEKLKNELAAELCAVLAFSATKNNDKVGLITFTDRIEKFIPPKKGSQHVLRVIRELLQHDTPPHRSTNIPLALDYLAKVTRKKATVFLVSDFYDDNLKQPLSLINKRHDLIAVALRDRRERTLPSAGLLELADAETGRTMLIDTAAPSFRRRYQNRTEQQERDLLAMFRAVGVDCINISADKPYLLELVRFFKMREKRR
jgi:uncharacterized protein (DUF58 family)